MKRKYALALVASLFLFSGCALLEKAVSEVQVDVVNTRGEPLEVKDVTGSMDDGVLSISVVVDAK